MDLGEKGDQIREEIKEGRRWHLVEKGDQRKKKIGFGKGEGDKSQRGRKMCFKGRGRMVSMIA